MVGRQITRTAANFAAAGWMSLAGLAGLALVSAPGCQSARDWMAENPNDRVHSSAQQASQTVQVNEAQAAEVRMSLARMLESQGKLDRAEQIYESATKANPDDPIPYWRLAIIQSRRGQVDRSVEFFNKALERSPGNPHIFSDVGYTHYLHGNYKTAEANYRQALALKPTDTRTHNNLGMLLARTGRVDEAIDTFTKGGLKGPAIAENVGLALMMEGDLNGAKGAYERAVALAPNSETAHEGLDRVMAMIGTRGGHPAASPNQPAVPARERFQQDQLTGDQLADAEIQRRARIGRSLVPSMPEVELDIPSPNTSPNLASVPQTGLSSTPQITARPAPRALSAVPETLPEVTARHHEPTAREAHGLPMVMPDALASVGASDGSRGMPPLPPSSMSGRSAVRFPSQRPSKNVNGDVLHSSGVARPGELPVIQAADFPKRRQELDRTSTGLTNVSPWSLDQPLTLTLEEVPATE